MMTIKTNNVPRPIIYGYELTDKELSEFDYYTNEDLEMRQFFRYKGQVYDLGEFMRVTDTMKNCHGFDGWDGYCSDSFFSGILVRYSDDFESVIVATYYS